jgi:hypothetical protein
MSTRRNQRTARHAHGVLPLLGSENHITRTRNMVISPYFQTKGLRKEAPSRDTSISDIYDIEILKARVAPSSLRTLNTVRKSRSSGSCCSDRIRRCVECSGLYVGIHTVLRRQHKRSPRNRAVPVIRDSHDTTDIRHCRVLHSGICNHAGIFSEYPSLAVPGYIHRAGVGKHLSEHGDSEHTALNHDCVNVYPLATDLNGGRGNSSRHHVRSVGSGCRPNVSDVNDCRSFFRRHHRGDSSDQLSDFHRLDRMGSYRHKPDLLTCGSPSGSTGDKGSGNGVRTGRVVRQGSFSRFGDIHEYVEHCEEGALDFSGGVLPSRTCK